MTGTMRTNVSTTTICLIINNLSTSSPSTSKKFPLLPGNGSFMKKMEYDNDRLRKPVHRTETFCWIFLVLLNTLVNATTFFFQDPRIWPVLLGINLLVFPAYLVYSKMLGPFLFFRKRGGFAFLLSLLSMLVIQIFLFALHTLLLKFPLHLQNG